MADLDTISNSVAIESKLKELQQDINDGMEQIAKGIFQTAAAVADAVNLLNETYGESGDKTLKEQTDLFFKETALANNPSDKSKLLTIASKFPLLQKYKDHIPQNFTAFYMIASSSTIEKNIEKMVSSKDERLQLNQETTIKQLRNLLNGRGKDQDPPKEDPTPNIFSLKFLDNEAFKTLEIKKLINENSEELAKVVTDAVTNYLQTKNNRISTDDLQISYSKPIENYTPPKPKAKKSA